MRTIIAALIIATAAPVAAEEPQPLPDRHMALMVSAMQCSAYAKEAGLADERVRLFNIGLLAGRKLIAKEIAASKWSAWPEGVEAGVDFIVGKEYERTTDQISIAIAAKVAASDVKTEEQRAELRRTPRSDRLRGEELPTAGRRVIRPTGDGKKSNKKAAQGRRNQM